jgi:MinD-like ATPase involved in chromosome partitioning or flagellar assembly
VISRVIALAGAKGSPGCSFLAVTLARCLAELGLSTLLLDADAEGGGLAALLDIASTDTSNGNLVDAPAMQVGSAMWFAETGAASADALNGLDWTQAARAKYRVVIVDLGHSAGTLQRQLSAAADWLLWVVVPDRSGLQRASAMLAAGRLGAASAGLVLNRVRIGCLEGAEAALTARHQLPVLARFVDDRQVADRLTRGLPAHRVRGIRRPLLELARSIHPDALAAGSKWR